MADVRVGRQTPTKSVTLPYEKTRGQEAVEFYNSTGRTAQPWQELLPRFLPVAAHLSPK